MSFVRERLPDPVSYFEGEGLSLSGRGVWRPTLCVFHDERTPSLRVNTQTGAWCCMGCGTRGGDVLSFHMQRHGLDFIEAAKALGAWSDGGKPNTDRPRAFSARAALEVLDFEALLCWVAAGNLAAGVPLTDDDRARLGVAAQRIHTVRSAAT